MKKLMIALMSLAVLSVGVLYFAGDQVIPAIKKWGTETYYVQIQGEGKMDGKDRAYHLKGYNKEGKEKDLSFYSFGGRQLQEGAYLRLYVKGENDVKSYEEVKKKDIPKAVQKKLQSNE
ncbi:YxeA family protein [Salinithrix halophila]|uniref:YxeA family protein n=1 Tax=Salinithrix halophila TaxID=1485204 RepID=A0ABV8JHQ9_9BACL